MASSIFSRIIAGEEPAHFVWIDELAVAFLTIAPLSPGHALVVPRQEVDRWTDASGELMGHCLQIAHRLGRAQRRAFGAPRAGLVIAGFEVPHLHLHVFPAWSMREFDWSTVSHPNHGELAKNARMLKRGIELESAG